MSSYTGRTQQSPRLTKGYKGLEGNRGSVKFISYQAMSTPCTSVDLGSAGSARIADRLHTPHCIFESKSKPQSVDMCTGSGYGYPCKIALSKLVLCRFLEHNIDISEGMSQAHIRAAW